MKNEIYIEDRCNEKYIGSLEEKIIISAVNETLKLEKIDYPCYVSISLVEEDEIQSLNREYRNIDSVTDVLSFPQVNLKDESFIVKPSDYYEGRLILGDVVICLKRAKEQSNDYGHSFEREIGYLTCHSILHLIGYDHETDSEREVMRKKEEQVMDFINLKR